MIPFEMPEPARRYLQHSIASGAKPAVSVELTMSGRMRISPNGKWLPLRASETITHPDGFTWRAEVGRFLRISGEDRYQEGEGVMFWRLWGLFPFLRSSGPDISRSARARFVMEAAAWLPSTLLGGRWEAAGDDAANARIALGGEEYTLRFQFSKEGGLRHLTLGRWGNVGTPGGAYEWIPFGVTCSGERTFGDYTIPVTLSGGWRPESEEYFEFFQFDVESANYR